MSENKKKIENKKKKEKTLKASSIDGGKKILCFITGIIAGNTIGNVIDGMLKADELDPSTGKPKILIKTIAPILLTGAGVLGAYQFQDNEFGRYISLGVSGAGLTRGVKIFIKKDLMNGLNFGKTAAAVNGLGEPVQVSVQEFMPDLPRLNGEDEPYQNTKLLSQSQATTMLEGGEYELLGEVEQEEVIL